MKLTAKIERCKKCAELAQHRTNVVIGEGPVPCPIVFLGEAPGRREDETGIPFYGMAGDILEAAAFKARLQRNKDYHILNVLKCRPPENRDPTIEEISNCKPFLITQLNVVQPKVIVAFGRYAQAFILNESPTKISVLKNMGKIIKTGKFYAILSCHPAYLGRNRGGELEKAFTNHIRNALRISKGAKPKCVVQSAPY